MGGLHMGGDCLGGSCPPLPPQDPERVQARTLLAFIGGFIGDSCSSLLFVAALGPSDANHDVEREAVFVFTQVRGEPRDHGGRIACVHERV